MILVTGGTGHLGSHVVYELIKLNQPVKVIYRKKASLAHTKEIFSYYENDESNFNRINWVEGDINDYCTLSNIIDEVSMVYHIAGYVTFNDKEKKRLNYINVEGTANIVNACLESGKTQLCFVSTIATLGQPEDSMVTEDLLWNRSDTASAYAKSKYLAEMEVWRGIHEGLNAYIVNPSVIIGPGMWTGPGSKLWQSVIKGLKYYPTGSTGFVDVRDVASIMVKLSQMDIMGNRYILNAGHLSHREFLTLLAKDLHVREPYVPVTHLLAKAALFLESLRAIITRTDKRFNSRTLNIASKNLLYSNRKVRELPGISFISVEESIHSAVKIFQNIAAKKF
jgi:dihydroflavonol-4-reductase